MKVAIAGASGFVGKALLKELEGRHEVVALSRSVRASDSQSKIEWRACDLFSLLDAEKALQGCEVAVYLVHSMRPSAELTQGNFADLDLIVADNFVRAAKKCGVKKIIYLGGLFPEGQSGISRHLRSRHEIEELFIKSQVPTTVLRAAVILGGEGSSFHIMVRLVERLPFMLCPKWTLTQSQPVALVDVVHAISYCVDEAETTGKIYDLGGPDIVSYRQMMKMIADIKGLKRFMLPVPLLSPGISTFWVCLVTGAPRALVKPLIEGLKVAMITDQDRHLKIPKHSYRSLEFSLQEALKSYSAHQKPLAFQASPKGRYEVRSVQRLPLPKGWRAEQVAEAYLRFLPSLPFGLIKVEVQGHRISFNLSFPFLRLLILDYAPERSWPDRQLFYVRGGLLAQSTLRGRLEFRESLGGAAVLAAIHDFRPRLPWFIYRRTQALIHLWVMYRFGIYLRDSNSLS